jgi:hypothetical protein
MHEQDQVERSTSGAKIISTAKTGIPLDDDLRLELVRKTVEQLIVISKTLK